MSVVTLSPASPVWPRQADLEAVQAGPVVAVDQVECPVGLEGRAEGLVAAPAALEVPVADSAEAQAGAGVPAEVRVAVLVGAGVPVEDLVAVDLRVPVEEDSAARAAQGAVVWEGAAQN